MNSYVFILCPPYCGSTLLWKLVSSSPTVSSLPKEGQFLPELRPTMRKDPWNADVKLPWRKIKKVWHSYWDDTKPLLIEKSPPHIIRTQEILAHFDPVYFLLMVRNPYAHCEGLMRRNTWGPKRAAAFAVRCMIQQKRNLERLDNTLCVSYENLTANPRRTARKIAAFLPAMEGLDYDRRFKLKSIDGAVERPIVDLNRKKINNLSNNQLKSINTVLKEHKGIMRYWGYRTIDPSASHAVAFLKTRSELALARGVRTLRAKTPTWIKNVIRHGH